MNIKVPVSWLRDYLKTDSATKTIINYLTQSGPAIELVTKVGDDHVLEVEVTSNRIDSASVFGLAREAHAILSYNNQKSQLTFPKGLNANLEPDTASQLSLDVVIKNHSLCPRFSAIILDNVKIKPSPAFIKNRLLKAGIRPTNNIVDITNYVMLELGQPMHAFDYDKIENHKMTLREAREAEKITTLDDQTRRLPKGAIVIEDGENRLIDLCGIMGAANSRITRRTKRVLLFAQAYDQQRIRTTTQALGFRTEAASRFEKGVDVATVIEALSRAVYLAKKTAGAKIASELIDFNYQQTKPRTITLSLAKLKSYLGVEIPAVRAANILSLLGFKTQTTAQAIIAKTPSWRNTDIESPEDLIEEIARIYGYQNLPSILPTGSIPVDQPSDLARTIKLKTALKYLGLTEVISYSLISQEFLNMSGVDKNQVVELANPLSEQWQFMRPTLLISQVAAIAQNQHLKENLAIFEIAKTYQKKADGEGELPQQDLKLAIALCGAQFSEIKGLVENIFEILGRDLKLQKLTGGEGFFEKSQSALVKTANQTLGILGLLAGTLTDHFNIDQPIAACELNLTKIYQNPTVRQSYHPIPKYPPVIEDISAIFDQKTPVADIILEVKRMGEPLVTAVEILDIYTDEKLGKNKKSITLRLTFQKNHQTPSQEEVAKLRNIIIDSLKTKFKAQIRELS